MEEYVMNTKKKFLLFVACLSAMSSYSQSLDCLNLLPNSRYSKNQALAKDSQVLFPCLGKTMRKQAVFVCKISSYKSREHL